MSDPAIRIRDVSCRYGDHEVIKSANIDIPKNCIYAFIGPSGCGKTTLLRSINRMNDLIPSFRLSGSLEVQGQDIYAEKSRDFVDELRRNVGMIFQQPNPLPTSILKNMYLPCREHYSMGEEALYERAVEKLEQSSLYEEVKDRLRKNALSLSGGQQQRLCIARALMLEPEILLFDEPCSALDPIATFRIEDLLQEMKKTRTIVIVTHNMEQASRISDYVSFFYEGDIVESGETESLFSNPETELLDRYISGKF